MAALSGSGGRQTRLARLIASGFGIGRVPLIAGTAGSAAAVLIGAGLMRRSPWALPAAALSATLGGLWSVRVCEATHDPGWVVIDEFAGQWITMLALRDRRPAGLFLAFALFRLIDIAKPWPVSLAERRKTAAGVMGDDLMAGGLAAGLLCAARLFRSRKTRSPDGASAKSGAARQLACAVPGFR